MIPFEEESFLTDYKELCKKLISQNPKNFNEGLLQKPTKLHCSVIQLELNEDEDLIKKVILVLDNIQEEIKKISEGNLTFNFEKFDVMDSIEKTRVVYAKMYEDENFKKLNNIIDLIIRSLIKEGIINGDKNSLSKFYINYDNDFYSIKLHLTLLNTTFLNKILKKEKKKIVKNFDSTEIMSFFNGEKLSSCKLNKIDFCVMREDKTIEKYELVKSYNM
jgi:hypothetical protein